MLPHSGSHARAESDGSVIENLNDFFEGRALARSCYLNKGKTTMEMRRFVRINQPDWNGCAKT